MWFASRPAPPPRAVRPRPPLPRPPAPAQSCPRSSRPVSAKPKRAAPRRRTCSRRRRSAGRYVIPTAPFVVNGEERGSWINKQAPPTPNSHPKISLPIQPLPPRHSRFTPATPAVPPPAPFAHPPSPLRLPPTTTTASSRPFPLDPRPPLGAPCLFCRPTTPSRHPCAPLRACPPVSSPGGPSADRASRLLTEPRPRITSKFQVNYK